MDRSWSLSELSPSSSTPFRFRVFWEFVLGVILLLQ